MIVLAKESLEEIARAMADKRVALFLDYDGTLTPIVERPELATLSGGMREILRKLTGLCAVAVVSGRDRGDVEALVALDNVAYAGSHGFDIAGPDGESMPGQGEPFIGVLREMEGQLREGLRGILGVLVESKKFSVAVHYRLVAEAQRPRVEQAVLEVTGRYPKLRGSSGKMVYEILPAVDCDKGRAVNSLLRMLNLDGPDALPFFLGDDRTDEDAFRVLRKTGIGILVAESPRKSHAAYLLHGVDEVRDFLQWLAEFLETRAD
ncbi:MAG: trehalose-phosphatase [SAR324 cluster bacterium]|nr:trehalose-phosphatase [SAR324 cluster bacterium]